MMNKQGPGKIDWTDYTWNPVSGCLHGCQYCYLQAMIKRFKNGTMEYRVHPDRFADPIRMKTPSKIFCVSAGDLFGDWVPADDIRTVLRYAAECPQHTFQFLTKNPRRYAEFDLPANGWYGTTDDGLVNTRNNLAQLVEAVRDRIRFVSFEPLLHPVDPKLWLMGRIDWIIIGGNSQRGAVKPPDSWADHLIRLARHVGAAVWVKDNYRYHAVYKEFPHATA
jgi:protein gp37